VLKNVHSRLSFPVSSSSFCLVSFEHTNYKGQNLLHVVTVVVIIIKVERAFSCSISYAIQPSDSQVWFTEWPVAVSVLTTR
jgi:hypothetical protein